MTPVGTAELGDDFQAGRRQAYYDHFDHLLQKGPLQTHFSNSLNTLKLHMYVARYTHIRAHQCPVNDLQIEGDWLVGPRDSSFQRREQVDIHHGAHITQVAIIDSEIQWTELGRRDDPHSIREVLELELQLVV